MENRAIASCLSYHRMSYAANALSLNYLHLPIPLPSLPFSVFFFGAPDLYSLNLMITTNFKLVKSITNRR